MTTPIRIGQNGLTTPNRVGYSIGMRTFRVTHTEDNHNDEWANRHVSECIRDEDGNFITICLAGGSGFAFANFVELRPDQIIEWEEA